MKKKIVQFFLLFCLAHNTTHTFPGQKHVQKACIHLFGDKPAPKKQQEITRKALAAFGIEQTGAIPIKLIRSDISLLQKYSSFTWFGIWFNEHAIECPKCAQWFAYHEAAHYYLQHPPKILLGAGVISGGSMLLCRHLAHQLTSSRIISFLLSSIGSKLITLLILPELVKRFELEASKLAAHKLCSQGSMDIVEDQIEHLKNLNTPESSLFLPSIPDQLGALQSIVQVWCKQEKSPLPTPD